MKKFAKWLAIILGSLVGLFIAAAIIVPLVVDVDKYRPQITQAADEHLNGKLELGKLSLSLWGQIRVEVAGLSVADPSGRKVVEVSDAYFHLPFSSILSGSPEMIFVMKNPAIHVIKYKSGKMNVMGLAKPSAAPAAPGAPAQPSAGGGGGGAMALPAFVARARLGVEMVNALVTYHDEMTGLKTEVKDFNARLEDISLSRTTQIKVWADLDTTMGKSLAIKGPFRLDGTAKPELAGDKFDHVTVAMKLNLDDLEMSSGSVFSKKKGMACNAELSAVVSQKEARLEQLVARFFNAELKASATLTHLGETAPPGAAAPSPVVNFSMKSNEIQLKPWNELVPMLKDYELGGSAQFEASAQGPSDKLGYQATLKVNNLTAKAPKLKAQPRFDLAVEIATDQIRDLTMTMQAPGNHLSVKGKMVSFAKPQAELSVTSSGMDLDQLIEFPPPGKKAAAEGTPAQGGGTAAPGGAAANADYDALLAPLRENKMMAATSATVNVSIKSLKAYDVKMTDMGGKLYFKDLNAGLEGFHMGLWSGAIKADFASNLKPKAPTYKFSSSVEKLELQQAVESQVSMFKNTLTGTAHFSIAGDGASFNPDAAKGNLKAKGSMKVDHAKFATIDVMKMTADAVNAAIGRVADKVPQLKGKSVGSGSGHESRYDSVSSDFTVADGRFDAPNFVAKPEANQGVEIKGDTSLGLKDQSLRAAWDVADVYNLTRAFDLGADLPGGVHVDHVLSEGGKPVHFTVHVGGTAAAPTYSYTEVPEQLAKVALGNVTGAAEGHAKAELKKRAESLIPKSAPPAVQNTLQDLGKKLFQ